MQLKTLRSHSLLIATALAGMAALCSPARGAIVIDTAHSFIEALDFTDLYPGGSGATGTSGPNIDVIQYMTSSAGGISPQNSTTTQGTDGATATCGGFGYTLAPTSIQGGGTETASVVCPGAYLARAYASVQILAQFTVDAESQGTLTTDLLSDGRIVSLEDDSNGTYLVDSNSMFAQVFNFTLTPGTPYTLSGYDKLDEDIGTYYRSSETILGEGAGFALDLEVQAVPEPRAMGIALCGIVPLLLRRRRSVPAAG